MTANHEQMERTTRPPVLSVASSPVVRSLRTGQRGFTLIEVLIVVVIVSILAAIAIPKFASSKEKAYVSKRVAIMPKLATIIWHMVTKRKTYAAWPYSSSMESAMVNGHCKMPSPVGSTSTRRVCITAVRVRFGRTRFCIRSSSSTSLLRIESC